MALHYADGERDNFYLFNDALNTFYLRLYGVRHMVKDHSDTEKGNQLAPHRLLLSINRKGSFICTILPMEVCKTVTRETACRQMSPVVCETMCNKLVSQ